MYQQVSNKQHDSFQLSYFLHFVKFPIKGTWYGIVW